MYASARRSIQLSFSGSLFFLFFFLFLLIVLLASTCVVGFWMGALCLIRGEHR